MYLVMTNNREKIIGVSDTLRSAREAGWNWLKKQYTADEWQAILDWSEKSEEETQNEMIAGIGWEDFDMEIIEVKRV